MIREYELFVKMDLKKTSYVKVLVEASDGLAFMRVEDKKNSLVRFIIPSPLFEEAIKFLNAIRKNVDLHYLEVR